jgi:asparagine N-glycosylation enzyme membrane subunit Stt3
VALLAEIGQVAIALGFSGMIALWLGSAVYLAVALVITAICAVLLFERAREEIGAQTKYKLSVTISLIVTPIVLGTIWPSLPPILAYTGWRRRKAVS